MGFLDKAFGMIGSAADDGVQGAFISLCIAAAGADGHVSSQEGHAIMTYINRLKMFDEVNENKMQKMFDKSFSELDSKGCAFMIDKAAKDIPAELRLTAFACVADIVLADGELDDEEKEVLEKIVSKLEIPEASAVPIIEVMLIKNKM